MGTGPEAETQRTEFQLPLMYVCKMEGGIHYVLTFAMRMLFSVADALHETQIIDIPIERFPHAPVVGSEHEE
jgi:hypothetical protein